MPNILIQSLIFFTMRKLIRNIKGSSKRYNTGVCVKNYTILRKKWDNFA